MSYLAGYRIGRFSITDIIANTPWRTDYVAYDEHLQTEAQYTLFTPDPQEASEAFVTLQDNIQRRSKIDSPTFAKILDVGQNETGFPYVITERVQGKSLAEFRDDRSHRFTTVEALTIAEEIVAALAEACSHNIWHPQLSAETIILTTDNQPIITELEFPISNKTLSAYAAPEQKRGELPTEQALIYTVGMILYEMLAGEHPTTLGWVMRSGDERTMPPLIGRVRPNLSPQTIHIVHACLRTQPWARLRTLRELHREIKSVLALEQQQKQRLPQRQPLSEKINYNVLFAIFMTVFVIGVLGLVGFFWFSQPSQAEQNETVLAQSFPTPPPTGTALAASLTATPFLLQPTATIHLISPANRQEFVEGTAITFTWAWSQPLDSEATFIVEAFTADHVFTSDPIATTADDAVYQTTIAGDRMLATDYRWRVTLKDATRRVHSSLNHLTIVSPTPTPSLPTPQPTPVPTATQSPTITDETVIIRNLPLPQHINPDPIVR